MPLYEYECFVCGEHFEKIRRVADASRMECPKCGGKVRRLLGVPALQFKGSGWYVTDYGKGNSKRSDALAKSEDAPPSPAKTAEAKKETTSKKVSDGSS